MICLRCGYCCQNLSVIIVDDPSKRVTEDNIIHHEGKGSDYPCKHLQGVCSGEYSCKIHNEPWYKETPCYAHTQVEHSEETECRMGRYLIDKQRENK